MKNLSWNKEGTVGIISIPQKRTNGKDRTLGFIQALDEESIKVSGFYQQVDFSYEETYNYSKKLIEENNGSYTKYIIMPGNMNGTAPIIKTLPKNDVYILDQTNSDLKEYASVYQNFSKDMISCLSKAKSYLELYNRLVLIFPGNKEPIGMVKGFLDFCEKYKLNHSIISDFNKDEIKIGDVFIIIDDRHLVNVILQSKKQKFKIRRDFGIISYNETPLKSVVESGITTISTDFSEMGRTLAEMVLNSTNKRIENPSDLILRNSL